MPATATHPPPKPRSGPRVFGMPFPLFRAGVFMLGLAPLARWVALGLTDGLTANPVEFLTRSAGTWTLIILMVTLAITPLRVVTGQAGLVKVRRMAGLFAFFYAALHFLAYAWWDQWFDPVSMGRDIAERPFILAGFSAFVLLIPLAVTSTKGWVRRLGGRNWQGLHRLIYLIGGLALLHLWWHKAGKNDFLDASLYLAAFAVLMAWRLWRWWSRRASFP